MQQRLLIAALLTVVAFFIAHITNLMVAHALTRVVSVHLSSPAEDSRLPKVDRLRLVEEILASGLFPRDAGLPVRSSFQPGLPGNPALIGPPIDAAKKVKLIGTVVRSGRGNMAVLEDIGSKKQTLYQVHDLVPMIGEIAEIRQAGILFRQGQQEEYLPLSNGLPTKPAFSSTVAEAGPSTAGTSEASLRHVLDRHEVAQTMNDLPRLLSQARATAYYVNGKQEGWKIEALTPQSFYEKIGLKNGDVLQRLNGADLRDPGMLLAFFQQAQDERTVTLDVLRENRKSTLVYEIR